ncbi:MAG: GNAT family N-acetyltransferase [Clostridia bacterium]|nr:GNAT family N-acetyltransferase [Clostridia bacterium]
MNNLDCVYFRLSSLDELRTRQGADVLELNWNKDIEMIRRFYKNFTKDVIDPPEEGDNCGEPLAIVENGEILSFAIPFSFKDGETEIGAVATLPERRGRGLCQIVISEMARRILESGYAATLTTGVENHAMQAAARAIGMMTSN